MLKIIGALAESNGTLKDVYNLARQVARNLVSVAASLEHVHVPGRRLPGTECTDNIPHGQMEIGIGIHNEPGNMTASVTLPEAVETMLTQMLDPQDKERYFADITKADKTVLLINNLGGVSNLEMGGIVAEVHKQLRNTWGIVPIRVLAGTFIASLNGLGFSISLLKIEDTGLGPGKTMLELLDAPAEASGWTATIRPSTWEANNSTSTDRSTGERPVLASENLPTNLSLNPERARFVLEAGLKSMIFSEADVTRYDTITGDGDCGICLLRGCEAILRDLSSSDNLPSDAVAFVNKITLVVENTMDGTSGALYAILPNALAHGLREQATGTPKVVDVHDWATALESSLHALEKYTPAAPGDRTLMDALVPFVVTLATTSNVKEAAAAARNGAEKTKGMKATLGRAVYVGAEQEWIGKVPDPGAWGL